MLICNNDTCPSATGLENFSQKRILAALQKAGWFKGFLVQDKLPKYAWKLKPYSMRLTPKDFNQIRTGTEHVNSIWYYKEDSGDTFWDMVRHLQSAEGLYL